MASPPSRIAFALLGLVAGILAVPGAPTPAAAAGGGALDVLVLGDSYSAGNGATDAQGQEQLYGPADCHRSLVNWGEMYATALRTTGQAVDYDNHACSGGVTADITSPRVLDTASHVEPTPAGVTTDAQADAALTQADPCDTGAYPDEEFWTYHATLVVPSGVTTYDCTRNLRPQADFVDADTDLVLFTMGGNDAGFSTIVQNCFVPAVRSASGCQAAVDAARALLPTIQQRLIADVAALRAHGLRDDAKIVQLGYPWLQVDNDYTVGGYPAGDQVRALVTDGDAAIAAIAPTVNAGHPGQLTFLGGVPERFSGHEPDATTPIGNPDRWINQVGDGSGTAVWYHPNRLGQQAYADLLVAHGTFGAQPGSGASGQVKAKLKVRLHQQGHRLRLRITIRLSDGTRPHGRLTIRGLHGHHRLAGVRVHRKDHGVVRVTVRLRGHRTAKVRVAYDDANAPVAKVTRRVR